MKPLFCIEYNDRQFIRNESNSNDLLLNSETVLQLIVALLETLSTSEKRNAV